MVFNMIKIANTIRAINVELGLIIGRPIIIKDGKLDVNELFNSFKVYGVRVVYGSLGCGKSTFLSVLGEVINYVKQPYTDVEVNIG